MADVPANTSTSFSIGMGGSLVDSLEVPADHDWFRIDLSAGQLVSVAVEALTLSDPLVRLRDSGGSVLFQNDDGGAGLDSLLGFQVPSTGVYFIDVGSAQENEAGSYRLSVAPYAPPPVASMDQIASWLTDGAWNGEGHHFPVGPGGTITVNLTGVTADSQSVARVALATWTDIIGVTFAEVTSGGQIVFDDLSVGTGAFSNAVWSGGITSSATVNVSPERLGAGPGVVRSGLQTYIHEIGHALGLGHAGDYNGGTAFSRYPYEALFRNDASAVSIMSYFDNGENSYYAGQGFTNDLVVTPQLADILAAGSLYGLSSTTRTGNTTYGFNNNSGRELFDAALHPNVAYTLVDSGGNDTLNYSGFSANQLINLNPESFSNVGSRVGNVVIARGTMIENAVGGSGNDTLIGNSENNILAGGGGSDTLYGLDGDDILSGNESVAFDNGTTVDYLYGGAGNDFLFAGYGDVVDGGDGFDILALSYIGTDHGITGDTAILHQGEPLVPGSGTINSIERIGDLVLTNFNDKMVIGDQDDPATVSAWDGDDTLIGQSMSITMYGGNGNDLLGGSVSDDLIYGENGDDVLIGYLGTDQMWGGAGADRFIFTSTQDSPGGYGATTHDFIRDWQPTDKIDLSAIDADPTAPGDQALVLSKVAFGFPAGAQPPGSVVIGGFGGTLFVSVFINGGSDPDMVIDLWSDGGESSLTAANLIL